MDSQIRLTVRLAAEIIAGCLLYYQYEIII
jgi:hypothetical protein